MTKEFVSRSALETQKIAENLAKTFTKGAVVTLSGDLGFGKTTFVQGFARGLGIEKRIISPTFVIVRKYSLPTRFFYHIDLYRMESLNDIEGLGLRETLHDKDAIVIIEWPEKLGELLPRKRIEITFDYRNENERGIVIDARNQTLPPTS